MSTLKIIHTFIHSLTMILTNLNETDDIISSSLYMWAQLGGEEVIYIYDNCYDNLFLHEFSFISIEKPTILAPKSTFKK